MNDIGREHKHARFGGFFFVLILKLSSLLDVHKGLLIVLENDRLTIVFCLVVHSFWTFRKQITIVFENDRFHKNNVRPFFIRLLFKNNRFWKKLSFLKIIVHICSLRTRQKAKWYYLYDDLVNHLVFIYFMHSM